MDARTGVAAVGVRLRALLAAVVVTKIAASAVAVSPSLGLAGGVVASGVAVVAAVAAYVGVGGWLRTASRSRRGPHPPAAPHSASYVVCQSQ